mgnify:CR=1 FL=1
MGEKLIKIVKRDEVSKSIFFLTPILAIILTLIGGGLIFYFLGCGISNRHVSLNVRGEKHVHHDFGKDSSYENRNLFDNFMASFRRGGKIDS